MKDIRITADVLVGGDNREGEHVVKVVKELIEEVHRLKLTISTCKVKGHTFITVGVRSGVVEPSVLDRKRVQELIKDNEDLILELLENMPDGYLDWTMKLREGNEVNRLDRADPDTVYSKWIAIDNTRTDVGQSLQLLEGNK